MEPNQNQTPNQTQNQTNQTPKEDVYDFTKPLAIEKQHAEKEKQKQEAKAAAKKLFNPAELTKHVDKIYEKEHPLFGVIRFGELTVGDGLLLAQCKSDGDRAFMAAYLMLKKAYPTMKEYTAETIREWINTLPLAEGAALLQFFQGQPSFLRILSLAG